MNTKNLHELITRYENNFSLINNSEHDEIFKWKAMKQFHSVWHSYTSGSIPFSRMFADARKECPVLIDNKQISPSNGIVKMAEVAPEEVERLFREVLLADDGGAIKKRHNNLEMFLEGIEEVRKEFFPRYWKYKQDRHAVSCYISFINPSDNYIYRYSDAEAFAQHIEFGMDIGSGPDFRLERYYKMCDEIVAALKEHPSLLEKHFKLIEGREEYYKDESLHLLAFDLMYCSRCYGFYLGLDHASKEEATKAFRLEQARENERIERQKQIDELDAKIEELELSIDGYRDISLVGVEVDFKDCGKGTIISQRIDEYFKVIVRFPNIEKTFNIHKKFSGRPRFENDEEIVEALSCLADTVKEIERLKKEKALLERA